MYPQRTKTEIVGDLLGAAIEDVYEGLPSGAGRQVGDEPELGGALYEERGERDRFRTLVNKHYRELERQLGNKTPGELYSGSYVVSEKDLKGR